MSECPMQKLEFVSHFGLIDMSRYGYVFRGNIPICFQIRCQFNKIWNLSAMVVFVDLLNGIRLCLTLLLLRVLTLLQLKIKNRTLHFTYRLCSAQFEYCELRILLYVHLFTIERLFCIIINTFVLGKWYWTVKIRFYLIGAVDLVTDWYSGC